MTVEVWLNVTVSVTARAAILNAGVVQAVGPWTQAQAILAAMPPSDRIPESNSSCRLEWLAMVLDDNREIAFVEVAGAILSISRPFLKQILRVLVTVVVRVIETVVVEGAT